LVSLFFIACSLNNYSFAKAENLEFESAGFTSSELIGYEFFTSKNKIKQALKKESSVDVCLVGEVRFPGQYSLPEGATLAEALISAGGPSVRGSMRRIRIFRNDGLSYEFDLYDLILNARSNSSPVLDGKETIVVAEAGVRVKVIGLVKKPGIYELEKNERSLGSVLNLCGIFEEHANDSKHIAIEIRRLLDGYKRRLVFAQPFKCGSSDNSGMLQFAIESFDLIEVKNVKRLAEKEIILSGHFRFPGKIVLRTDATLSDFVCKENLLPAYSEKYAELLRADSSSHEYRVVPFAPGRLIEGDRRVDLQLQDNDRIVLFGRDELERKARVSVEGAVNNPGIYKWKEGIKISDLIDMAGGLTAHAKNTAEIHRKYILEGKLDTKMIMINPVLAVSQKPRHDLEIEPFDVLVVGEADK
jgi:protein involved in polysaccharide export with SLBB domain